MYNWYHQLAESHPDTVTLNESIGKTYYGRDILAVHFTDGRSVGEATPRRPKIYFQCLLHPSMCTCIHVHAIKSVVYRITVKCNTIVTRLVCTCWTYATWISYKSCARSMKIASYQDHVLIGAMLIRYTCYIPKCTCSNFGGKCYKWVGVYRMLSLGGLLGVFFNKFPDAFRLVTF